MAPKPQRRALGEWAVGQLYELIFTGQLPAGADLGEEMLCQKLDVSRATVGFALRQLEQEGLAELAAGNGRRQVAAFSMKDVGDLYDVRTAIESFAITLAAPRFTAADIEILERVQTEMESLDRWSSPPSVRDFGVDFEFHFIIAERSGSKRALASLHPIWNQTHALLRHLSSVGAYGDAEEDAASFDDHRTIIETLRRQDAEASRQAMVQHLSGRRDKLLAGLQARGSVA